MNAPNRERRELREAREVVREEPVVRAPMDYPTHEVMFWVMGMRRYGHLREVKGVTDEGYFRYEAIEKDRP
jgi:hypothetical protein